MEKFISMQDKDNKDKEPVKKYCLSQCRRDIVEIDGKRVMYCSGCDRILK